MTPNREASMAMREALNRSASDRLLEALARSIIGYAQVNNLEPVQAINRLLYAGELR